MFTCWVENPNSTHKRKKYITRLNATNYFWTERMSQEYKRNRRPNTYRSVIPQRNQNKVKNVAMPWIDYKKTYDMIPQTWIIECRRIYKISDKITNAMKNWTKEITACWINTSKGKNTKRHFPGILTHTISICYNKCYIIAEGFRFMPLSLVRLRTFRLSTWVS